MKASSNPSTKPSEDETKSKSAREASDYVLDRHRATSQQEADALHNVTKSYPGLQVSRAFHSIKTLNRYQHLQRSTMGETTISDSAQSVTDRVRGALQGTPNHPLMGSLKKFGRAHPVRFPYGVGPHPKEILRKMNASIPKSRT